MMTYLDHKGNALTPDQLKACFDRAQAKSRANDPRLERISQIHTNRYPTYSVIGQTGVYTVTVDESGFHCDCIAGQNTRCCWHAASAYRLRLAERSARTVNAAPAKLSLEALYDLDDAKRAAAGVR